MTYLQTLDPPGGREEFSRLAKEAGEDHVIAFYERVMRQAWEDRQEAERAKVEREAPALEAFGFPPEEFFPVEWPGPASHTFADMVREWEAPLMAHIERKRDQLAEAFDGLFTLADEFDKPTEV